MPSKTRSSDRISGDKRRKGWPRFPTRKLKTLVPISRPEPIPEEPFQELSRSAQCHSGIFLWIWKPMDCTVCIFSDECHTFNLCRKKGDRGEVCCETVTTSLHVLPPVSHFVEERSSPFTETDIFLLVGVKNKHFSSPWKPEELILLGAGCSLKEICPRYQRPRWICSTFKLTEPTVCQTTVLKKKKKTRCQNTQICSQAIASACLTDSQCLQIQAEPSLIRLEKVGWAIPLLPPLVRPCLGWVGVL